MCIWFAIQCKIGNRDKWPTEKVLDFLLVFRQFYILTFYLFVTLYRRFCFCCVSETCWYIGSEDGCIDVCIFMFHAFIHEISQQSFIFITVSLRLSFFQNVPEWCWPIESNKCCRISKCKHQSCGFFFGISLVNSYSYYCNLFLNFMLSDDSTINYYPYDITVCGINAHILIERAEYKNGNEDGCGFFFKNIAKYSWVRQDGCFTCTWLFFCLCISWCHKWIRTFIAA